VSRSISLNHNLVSEAYKKEQKEKIISQQEKAKTFSEAEKLRQEQPVDPSAAFCS
jgi:hypothetical protein